jgi:hypothetical protein
VGCENSPNKSLYKHALFVTWITILITLSLLLLLCEIKVHYFKFKFNPSKLARWLYTIVRCHLEEWWTKMDTGKVPNGQFFFCPSLSASENVNYSFWHETSTIYHSAYFTPVGENSVHCGLTWGVKVNYSLHIYLFIWTYLLFSVLLEPRFHALSLSL